MNSNRGRALLKSACVFLLGYFCVLLGVFAWCLCLGISAYCCRLRVLESVLPSKSVVRNEMEDGWT